MSKYKILEVWYQEFFIIRPWNWGLLFGPVWVPANIWQVYHFSQFQYTLSIRFFLTFLQVFGNAIVVFSNCSYVENAFPNKKVNPGSTTSLSNVSFHCYSTFNLLSVAWIWQIIVLLYFNICLFTQATHLFDVFLSFFYRPWENDVYCVCTRLCPKICLFDQNALSWKRYGVSMPCPSFCNL